MKNHDAALLFGIVKKFTIQEPDFSNSDDSIADILQEKTEKSTILGRRTVLIQIIKTELYSGNRPEFSWKLAGDENQKSWQLTIRECPGRVKEPRQNVIWDSGIRPGRDQHAITCDAVLPKGKKYSWSVRITGEQGSSDTAEGDCFYTEIPQWKAKWIEPDRVRKPLTDVVAPVNPIGVNKEIRDSLDKLDPAVLVRKQFCLPEQPDQALLYASAHGIYGLWVNGTFISDDLAPGFTSYAKRLEYQVYDVTERLQTGENSICMLLADGWYTGKIACVGIGQQFGKESAALFQLNCVLPEGESVSVCTEGTERWDEGAIRYADLYIGEYYDAALETDWTSVTYDDRSWKAVRTMAFGYENLKLQSIAPVVELETITPRVLRTPQGDLLLDAGKTIAGRTSFRLNLKKGDLISLEHSETIDRNGNYLQNIIGQNKDQTDFYLAAQDGEQWFEPRYTFHGYRYVRVRGTEDMEPTHYQIHVIGTRLEQTGTFRCSDERLNQLQDNILRSQRGNMISIPTDCPQRERTGWAGDVQVFAPTGCYEMDIEGFLRHWVQDLGNDQLADGQIQHVAPYMASHDVMKPAGITNVSAAGWSDAAVIVPWRLYQFYGNIRILQEFYPMMTRYMEAVARLVAEKPEGFDRMTPAQQRRQQYLWNTGYSYGDWLMPSIQMSGKSIFEVIRMTGYPVATLQYAMTTQIMAQIAQCLGDQKAAEQYRETNRHVREAFAEEYGKPDGTLTCDYQGCYVLAILTGAILEKFRGQAVSRLVQLIHQNHDLLDTGFLSVAYLLPVLSENGQQKLADQLLFRDECPSWLYEVKMGATTMWEYWNGYAPDGTPSDGSMNHFAFGCVGAYLFRTILGIRAQEPGFSRVLIAPDFGCGLQSVSGSYESVHGCIGVAWKIADGLVTMDVTIPPNTEAVLCIGEERKTVFCGSCQMTGHIAAADHKEA